MRFKGLRWKAAAAVAFLVGIPFVPEAKAQGAGDIVTSAIDLALSIVGLAGNS